MKSIKPKHRGSRSRKKNQHKPLSLEKQIIRLISRHAHRGYAKTSGKKLRSDRTVSRYQGDLTRAVRWIASQKAVSYLKAISTEEAQAYINARIKDNLTRQTLQGYAMALQLLPNVGSLNLPPVEKKQQKPSRAYTVEQIRLIQSQLPAPYQLAIQILWESGCRVQDLASLRLAHETTLQKARHHALDPQRFTGREHWIKVQYRGKGGHDYQSAISPQTAHRLETYRLTSPRDFKGREGIRRLAQQYYDLPAGQCLSRAFSQAAYRVLGWSHGAHGLRHTYAQTRLQECLDQNVPLITAKRWVSQTLGHYRPHVVNVYLR